MSRGNQSKEADMNKWKLAKLLMAISFVLAAIGAALNTEASLWFLVAATVVGIAGFVTFFSRQNDLNKILRGQK